MGSFDEGGERQRFAQLQQSGSRLTCEMEECWDRMQRECAVDQAAQSLLSVPFAGAGTDPDFGSVVPKLQKRLTVVREDHAAQLNSDILALPVNDVRRTAWLCADEYSAALFIAWPRPGQVLCNGEWTEAVATYFGAASPACAPHVGKPIVAGGKTVAHLDAYGVKLLNTARIINAKNGRTNWHDADKFMFVAYAREAQVPCTCEVFGLFTSELPAAGRDRVNRLYGTAGKRQGMVPDLMCRGPGERDHLYDVKTMGLGENRYPARLLRGGVRGRPIEERAAAVSKAYEKSARKMDVTYGGVPPGTDDPVLRKLRSFGDTRGLCLGAFGEVSAHVRDFVSFAASASAHKHWTGMGARTVEAASAAIRLRMRCELTITHVREYHRLKLRRLDDYVRGRNNMGVGGLDEEAAANAAAARRFYYEASAGLRGRAGWPRYARRSGC